MLLTNHRWERPRRVCLRSFQQKRPPHGDQRKLWAGFRCLKSTLETTLAVLQHLPMCQAKMLQRRRPLCTAPRRGLSTKPLTSSFTPSRPSRGLHWSDLVSNEKHRRATSHHHRELCSPARTRPAMKWWPTQQGHMIAQPAICNRLRARTRFSLKQRCASGTAANQSCWWRTFRRSAKTVRVRGTMGLS